MFDEDDMVISLSAEGEAYDEDVDKIEVILGGEFVNVWYHNSYGKHVAVVTKQVFDLLKEKGAYLKYFTGKSVNRDDLLDDSEVLGEYDIFRVDKG